MESPTIWEHALAVGCGLIAPVLGVWQQRRRAAMDDDLGPFETPEKIAMYWSNSVVLWILAGAVVAAWLGAGRSLADLGLTAAPERWPGGTVLGVVVLVAWAGDAWWHTRTPALRTEARARWRRDTPFMPETRREVGHSLVLVTSAALCEEIVFRGFLVAYVASFTGTSVGGLAVAVVVPALVFGICHAYQGPAAMAKVAGGAVLFGAMLVLTGSLWIPIAVHFVVDLAGSLLGPRLMGEKPPAPDPHES